MRCLVRASWWLLEALVTGLRRAEGTQLSLFAAADRCLWLASIRRKSEGRLCKYRSQSYTVMFLGTAQLPLHLGKPLCALLLPSKGRGPCGERTEKAHPASTNTEEGRFS